jgi:hypothetical protein
MTDLIFDALCDFFEGIVDLISYVIEGVISLFDHVIDYFKGLKLRKGKDIPFIAKREALSEMIHNAPVKDLGIFEATYNEDTGEIENGRMLEADEISEDILDIIGDEKLVVLT